MVDALVRAAYAVAYRVLRVWWFFRRPNVHGAFVAVWHDDALLVIRNSYRRGETLPIGLVERGETPRAAARRELFEEVGIDAPENELVPATDFDLDWDYKHDRASIFEWHPGERPRIRVDAREVIWGEFIAEGELDARSLVPHVVRYLEWHRARSSAHSSDPASGPQSPVE